ncbi:nitrate- and nitrite sensing domain-containing protein [Streptosporangium sp. KLBMP 9127]|nr:nitrate- and nitrite sensing domain-containing protein [Streptosporangium sp. KLBMP 9127]
MAIWAYAATSTVSSGQELLRIGSVFDEVIVPARTVTTTLQQERLGSSAYVGQDANDRGELDKMRAATDRARSALERRALADGVSADTPPILRQRVGELLVHLERLADIRVRVDTRNFTRLQILEAYNAIVDSAFRVFDKMRVSADIDLIDQARAITLMGHSREQLSRQAALLNGVLTSKKITGEELTEFTRLVNNRRMLYAMAFEQLDTGLRAPYLELQTSPAFREFQEIEGTVMAVRAGRPLPAEASSWAKSARSLSDTFDRVGGEISKVSADRAAPLAVNVLIEIIAAAGLGLLAIALSIFLSVRFVRRIGVELGGLQEAALNLAHKRLPDVVDRLRRGERVDVAEEMPRLAAGTTVEIASVGEAFVSVQRTAIQAAVGQAELRKGVGKVFLNLARRSQSLLHRQLAMLETMERRATDAETLDDLFALDHMTTRMRRHSEGLIILSGAQPGRGWRNPVTIFDIIRASTEEIEDYLRVSIDIHSGPALVGTAVTDVVHLIAELVENATIFSPPQTQVHVRGEIVARGYALEVEDRGLGMGPAEYAAINHRLTHPPEFDLADSDRLGLFVVGRLAARQGIHVSLRPSPYGGTTAILLIPGELVVQAPELPNPMFTPATSTFSVERVPPVPPAAAPPPPPAATPPADLPRRVRQANLVPQLREPVEARRERPRVEEPVTEEPVSATLLASFRSGWRRAEEGHRP